jgi:hypothetical protein
MPSQDRFEIHLDTSLLEEALQGPLALVETEERRLIIEAYLQAVRPFLHNAAFNVLAVATDKLNEAASERLRARVEHRGDGGWLVIETAEGDPATEAPFVEGDLEKVTIRLPRELKEAVNRLAGSEGVSANSWYIRGLARVLARDATAQVRDDIRNARRRSRGNSMRGYVGE